MMKIRSALALAALTISVAVFPAISASAADSFVPDVTHSSVIFKVKHSNISYVFGRFNDFDAKIEWSEENPEISSVTFKIKTASVDTGNEQRDQHLRIPDFFNAQQYPEISFESNEVRKINGNVYQVSGEATMLGQSRPVSFEWTHIGSGENARGEFRKGGIATFTIKRSDFGMDFMLGALSDEIEMTISLQSVRQ